MIDLLFSRYNNPDTIMNMDYEDGFQLIKKAFEKVNEEKAWQMWLSLYPNMTQETFVPFSEFYHKHTQPISKTPKDEILKKAKKIRSNISGSNTIPAEK